MTCCSHMLKRTESELSTMKERSTRLTMKKENEKRENNLVGPKHGGNTYKEECEEGTRITTFN
eukprot:6976108-Heterocapsa_arctica.AAC.1